MCLVWKVTCVKGVRYTQTAAI